MKTLLCIHFSAVYMLGEEWQKYTANAVSDFIINCLIKMLYCAKLELALQKQNIKKQQIYDKTL